MRVDDEEKVEETSGPLISKLLEVPCDHLYKCGFSSPSAASGLFSSEIRSKASNNVASDRKCEILHYLNGNMHANNLEKTVLAYAKAWHHVDASGRTLGKLAERIATVLMGKHKPIFDPGGASLNALMIL